MAEDEVPPAELDEPLRPRPEPPTAPSGTSGTSGTSHPDLPESGSAEGPDEPATTPAPAPTWVARARVPVRDHNYEMVDWDPGEPPRRGIVVPLLIATLVVLLVALVGVLVWLGSRAGTAPPPTTPPPTTTTRAKAPDRPRTTRPPATIATVTVPDLVGLPYEEALAKLPEGITAQVVERMSASVKPGVVIGTNPPAGTTLPVPATIKIFVSMRPGSAEPEPTGSAEPGPSTVWWGSWPPLTRRPGG